MTAPATIVEKLEADAQNLRARGFRAKAARVAEAAEVIEQLAEALEAMLHALGRHTGKPASDAKPGTPVALAATALARVRAS